MRTPFILSLLSRLLVIRSLVISSLIVSVLSGCAEQRDIGQLVHVDEPAEICFAAMSPGGEVVWVHPSGARREGPSVPDAKMIAYDHRRQRLLAATDEEIVEIDVPADRIAERRSGGAELVWPVADGLLTVDPSGRWTHTSASGASSSRLLPRPQSIWERADYVEWIGVGYPRSPEAVLIRTHISAPLAEPEVVDTMPMGAEVRAAAGPATLVFGRVESRILYISWGSEEAAYPVAAERLVGLSRLDRTRYLATFSQPPSVAVLDLELNDVQQFDRLRGPASGPIPCHATIPLP